MPKEERERIKVLLKDTITILIKNGLEYKHSLSLEALIGVTLDEDDVFLVSINELVKNKSDQSLNASDHGDDDSDGAGGPSPRKRRRGRKRRSDNGPGGDAPGSTLTKSNKAGGPTDIIVVAATENSEADSDDNDAPEENYMKQEILESSLPDEIGYPSQEMLNQIQAGSSTMEDWIQFPSSSGDFQTSGDTIEGQDGAIKQEQVGFVIAHVCIPGIIL